MSDLPPFTTCPACGLRAELVEEPHPDPNVPLKRYQCVCGKWTATYTSADEK